MFTLVCHSRQGWRGKHSQLDKDLHLISSSLDRVKTISSVTQRLRNIREELKLLNIEVSIWPIKVNKASSWNKNHYSVKMNGFNSCQEEGVRSGDYRRLKKQVLPTANVPTEWYVWLSKVEDQVSKNNIISAFFLKGSLLHKPSSHWLLSPLKMELWPDHGVWGPPLKRVLNQLDQLALTYMFINGES